MIGIQFEKAFHYPNHVRAVVFDMDDLNHIAHIVETQGDAYDLIDIVKEQLQVDSFYILDSDKQVVEPEFLSHVETAQIMLDNLL